MALVGTISASNDFGFKNRIINGGMQIDQRNAGASVTVGAAGGYYPVDRFYGQASAASKFTLQRSTDVPTGQGFLNSIVATSSSAYSLGAGDYFIIRQAIEGLYCFDLLFGNSNAKTVTLSFWVKSSLTGTFSGHLTNATSARWYPFTYTISSANTWEQKSITIPGDTTGTWATDTSVGIFVGWSMGTGASNETTANAWTASTGIGTSGAVDLVATSGATFYITGVQFEKSSTATPFDYRPYTIEQLLCQRYYHFLGGDTAYQNIVTGTYYGAADCVGPFRYPVEMRISPSISKTGTWTALGGAGAAGQTVSADQKGTKNVQLGFTGGTSGVSGQSTTIRASNDTAFRITFDSEY